MPFASTWLLDLSLFGNELTRKHANAPRLWLNCGARGNEPASSST